MGDSSDRVGTYMVLGLLIGALIMGLAYGIPNWDWSSEFWFREKPALDFVISAATITVAGLAAFSALATLRMSSRNNLSQRFQNGTQLFCDPSEAKAVGGLTLLTDVAREQPKLYADALMMLVMANISERSSEDWNVVCRSSEDAPKPDKPTIIALRSISEIAELNVSFGFPQKIYRPYLNLVTIQSQTFVDWSFQAMAVGTAAFENCTFINCEITANIVTRLAFKDCTFQSTKISRIRSVSKRNGLFVLTETRSFGLEIDGNTISTDGEY